MITSICHREERSLRRRDLKLRVKTGAMHGALRLKVHCTLTRRGVEGT
jgi:hypothetical protein